MLLSKQLKPYGVNEEAFREMLDRTFKKMFPDLGQEQLLYSPSLALQFVGRLPEDVICRNLRNQQKNPQSKPRGR